MISKKFNNSLGLYRVPLILFHPKHSFEQSLAQKITQHIDISPTVLDFLNIPASSIVCGGESVLSKGAGRAYHYLNPGWQYLSGDLGVKWTEGQKPEYFQWNAQTGESKPIESTEKPLSELKLFIQYYFEGFVDQQWPFVCAE
jgi:arylsulfatase A-like enzyme